MEVAKTCCKVLSVIIGIYQVEALRREFKTFTDVIEHSMKAFQDKVGADLKKAEGKLFIKMI